MDTSFASELYQFVKISPKNYVMTACHHVPNRLPKILRKGNLNAALLELYKCKSLHRQALELLHKLVDESRSSQSEITQRFKPEDIVEYLKLIIMGCYRQYYKTSDVVWNKVLGVKNQHDNRISVVEMRILRWICGKTR
ncbi:vacuolar sorting protein 39 domain 1 protein [Medicago truncatula]|uniref:Vacuolar sorting protein 39 domain 1 protein n=1 Tax=Medicago truncatula TaxID=3880 RepID=G7L8L3_MEDTR|nr:vacuolar sorting protein 39 domain 1 protein [Medicago truncatula]